MGCSGAQKTKIDGDNKKKDSQKDKNDFQVRFFSEDESSSGTFSLNSESNKDEKDSDKSEEENQSTKSKKTIADIRVFDYSSDESDSQIDYKVIDLSKKKEPQPEPEPIPSSKPKPKKTKKKKSIKEETPPKKEETPQKKEKTPSHKQEKTPSPKKEKTPSPKKEETPSPKKEKTPTPKQEKTPSPKKEETPPRKRDKKYKTMKQKAKRLSAPKIEEIEPSSSSSEFESEKIDSPHPSIIIESNIKENIYSEYSKNLNFYSSNEKNISSKLDKESYNACPKNKYRKNILLHNSEVTSICALDGITKNICYATSSLDNTIKLWTGKFKLIDTISKLLVPSLFLCEFDFINILSAEGVYIKMYDIESEIYECKKTFRNHIDIIYIIYPLVTQNILNFFSGGEDTIIRLWQRDDENPIRYYEGHQGKILDIKNIAHNNKLMISLSEDKKCIVWEISNSNMIKEIELYFTPLNLIETKEGFGVGGYDNKIRFFYSVEKNCELKECIITKFFGNKILFADDNNIFSLDANGNINLIDINEKKVVIIFEGNNSDFVQIIKSYNWNPDKEEYDNLDSKKFAEDRTIVGINKDGYGYTYKSELFTNLKIYPKEIYRQKKEESSRKNDRRKTFMKAAKKRASVVQPKNKRVSFNYNKLVYN